MENINDRISKGKIRYNTDDAIINIRRKLKINNDVFWLFMGKDALCDMTDEEKKIKLVGLCGLLYKR